MAEIAKWGNITFAVSSDSFLSFSGMKRTISAKWTSHPIIGKRPKLEYQNPEMEEISMEVIFDAELGINPREEMQKFRRACKKGFVNHFYINGKKIAKRKFYISEVTENWNEIWNEGELVRATASVTFCQYR